MKQKNQLISNKIIAFNKNNFLKVSLCRVFHKNIKINKIIDLKIIRITYNQIKY